MSTRITATRYHDFSAGHRVAGHESKCAYLHGHNYRAYFTVEADLDALGRVMDFSVIKERLCAWLENNWDHRFLAWEADDQMSRLRSIVHHGDPKRDVLGMLNASLVWLPFNPTAENMAHFLLNTVGPMQLAGTPADLIGVELWETRKCQAAAWLNQEVKMEVGRGAK